METNRTMMPSQLETLIHYYYTPVMDIPENNFDIISFLIREGLLKSINEGYTTTERGKVYVEALLNIPLPIQKWSMKDGRRNI